MELAFHIPRKTEPAPAAPSVPAAPSAPSAPASPWIPLDAYITQGTARDPEVSFKPGARGSMPFPGVPYPQNQ